MKPRSVVAALAIIASAVCSTFPAQASVLTIFMSGIGSGSLGSNSFSDSSFTFELIGPDGNGNTGIPLTTAEVFIPALSSNPFSITGPSLINLHFTPDYAFLRPNTNNGGVSTAADYAQIFFTAADFANLHSNSGAVVAFPTSIDFLNPIPTSGGALSFDGVTPLFFDATKSSNTVSAVPELSTWAMMLIGFAGIGFVAYRRAKKSSAAAAVA